jgi:methionyl-tRNA formyltransferase
VTRAVAFAYAAVGARCLKVLYESGVTLPLVYTHEDDPAETRWFASVAELARRHGSAVSTTEDLSRPQVAQEIGGAAPDFIFSFYYRRMIPASLLALARRGALNMHGSLLPKYRGRAPVNWAVLNGETETGASLHYMVEKPDAGPIVDQERVRIGPDDTAGEVATRVTEAAAIVLRRSLPKLIAGTADTRPIDLEQGSYFGGRRPGDGEFRWTWPAARIHNLVRAVAPPFPGAFAGLAGRTVRVERTRRLDGAGAGADGGPNVAVVGDAIVATCGDGRRLELAAAFCDGVRLAPASFRSLFGPDPVPAN